MLTSADFIHIPYTTNLSEGGIAYALRSLPYTYNRVGGSPYERLRRIVAGVAVELAFRHYLSEHNIPFDTKGATPFSDPDQYDVALGKHRCDIKSFLITYREQISQIRRDPSQILSAPALVPLDQYNADGYSNNDVYLFAFINGLLASSQDDMKKVVAAGQPHYLTHAMPNTWCKPKNWKPLAPVTLKSEAEQPITVEVNGQVSDRDFATQSITLTQNTPTKVTVPFFSISSLHVKTNPQGRIGVHSPFQKEIYVIQPFHWHNIWVYGMDIYLTGYITRGEFRQQSQLIQPGARVFQYDQTRTKNLAVPVSQLHPLHKLLERTKP